MAGKTEGESLHSLRAQGSGREPGNLCDPLGKLMGKGWREGKEVRQERTGKEG